MEATVYWISLVIFIARIVDVSLGTLRIILVSRGLKVKAALLGFVEVLIWIIVVAQLIQHLDNWLNYVAYAGGFAIGTYLGITIENKLKIGTIIIRIITSGNADVLVARLKKAGVMHTSIDALGGQGAVKIIFTVIKRRRWNEIIEIIESFDSDVFYSVEDVKYASGGDGELHVNGNRSFSDRLLRVRKGM